MEGAPSKHEKIDIEIRLATPEDWEAYKKLRLEAITGLDVAVFGPKAVERDLQKTDEGWREDLSPNPEEFVILSWHKADAIGMGVAREIKEEGKWHVGSDYVKPEFRGGIGKRILALRLREIIKRGGITVEMGVRPNNTKSIHIYKSFGFKDAGRKGEWQMMEVNLGDPAVINKINEILNAG